MPIERIRRSHLAGIYLHALRNEIAIDIDGYAAIDVAPAEFSYAPRLSSIWPRLVRNPQAAKLTFVLLRAAWMRGLYVPFFITQYLSLRRTVRERPPVRQIDRLHVLFSALAPELVARADGTDALGLVVPWQSYPNGIPHSRRISIGEILSRGEMYACLRDAVAIARRIARRKTPFADWHLQTYTLFRWICVARCIENLASQQVVMANHYDRWAVLLDRLSALPGGGRLAIAQHGIEAERHLPTKLKSVETIHVFNHREEQLFKSFILAPDLARTVRVRFLDSSITLVDGTVDDRVRVVIVGHPQYDTIQIRFAKAARARRPDARMIYKPHPTARGIDPEIRDLAEIWDRAGVFPRCEFVFSYFSTLGQQYRDAGVPTYIHDAQVTDDQIADAISQVPDRDVKDAEKRTRP